LTLSAPKDFRKTAFLVIILIGSIVSMSYGLQRSVIVPSSGSIYYRPEERVFLEDEFEKRDFSVWSGTSTTVGDNASVISVNPYEGVYHARFQTDAVASGVKFAYCYEDLVSPIGEIYARGYFYIVEGLPLDDNNDRFWLISFEVGGQLQSAFRIYRSGDVDRFNVAGYNGSSIVSKSIDDVYPVEGRWYCVEFYIKVHSTKGEYRAWINGVERVTVTNIDTTRYGAGVSRICFGLPSVVNVQHYVEVYLDSVVISTRYIGQLRYDFGVIGSVEEDPAVSNFYWLFGNQSISYRRLSPVEITRFEDVERFDGLVVFTKQGGYNVTAIKQFAQTRVVISHLWDFCTIIYPYLNSSMQVVSTNTVTYVIDWGNFRAGDLVEMRNETGNINQLTTVLASGLASYSNVTTIARYDISRVAFFHMSGTQSKSGFYVMDMDATTPETEWAGIWHLFPAIKMVKDFPTGKYARWFAIGINWPSITWVYSWMTNFTDANSDIVNMKSIGTSVQGQPINALFIGNGSRYAIVDGSIHGNEKSTTFACLRLAEVIIEDYRVGGYWGKRLKEYTIIIIPVLNPDGFVANSRYNANGADLNRQFPPGGNTTEPEAWALRWLMGNFTPTIYVNNHEGGTSEPNKIFYGPYQEDMQKNFSMDNIRCAIAEFATLQHWGYYTDGGLNLWIGGIHGPYQGGSSYAIAYASWKHQASSMLVESFVWNPTYKARQCLYAIDYYVCLALSFISHYDKLVGDGFIVYSNAKIESAAWSGQLCIAINSKGLTTSSLTKVYVADRGKPISVKIDGDEKAEGDGWTFDSGIMIVMSAENLIEAAWS
jgi:hypothetical protein